MKRLLIGLAALPFLAGVSFAAQPGPVTDNQTGTDYITQELKLPAANARSSGRELFGIVYREIRP